MFFTLLMYSCIGTDILDVELFNPEVRIVSQVLSIEVGTQFQFEAIYLDEFGMEDPDADIQWLSSDPSIVSIEQNGIASAIEEGSVVLTASFGGLSDEVSVLVNRETTNVGDRNGTFSGLNGYYVTGDFTLADTGDNLVLNFASNFVTASGPGLYVYLTNSQTGTTGGVELGPIKAINGAQSYDVPEGVELLTYDYVLIHCKPFNIPFGLGQYE